MRVFKLSSKKITNFKSTFLINNYIEINSIFSSYEAMWLRQTRNSIVHYEKPIDGLLGNKEDNKILEEYSVKTITILSKIINEILKLK